MASKTRDYHQHRNPTTGPADHPMKRCPCCGIDRGRNAFAKNAKFCNDCRRDPDRRAKPTGPTACEREEARAQLEVAAFLVESAKIRELAGCPRRAGA